VVDEFVFDVIVRCFTPDFARRLTQFTLDEAVQQRVDYLAGQANEGLLAPNEDEEYRKIIDAGNRLGILQARARNYLRRLESETK
jgi:hypothetical protein